MRPGTLHVFCRSRRFPGWVDIDARWNVQHCQDSWPAGADFYVHHGMDSAEVQRAAGRQAALAVCAPAANQWLHDRIETKLKRGQDVWLFIAQVKGDAPPGR